MSDDGYGRFWTKPVGGRQRAVRPQRYAFEEATGETLPSTTLLLHACDVPLCVHADADPERSHVSPGTHRENMLDRVQKGHHRNRWTAERYRGLPREERVRRSRELRDAVRAHGWDSDLIRRALNGIGPDQPTLW
ncbi:hypothetical protein [Streptomyces sp. NPDC057689]|uniref:hypothetical protein n=1 Tax=Streptomyces sp. NPDC057689 TaxID=3346213 RepID=UPI0036918A10